MNHSESSWTRQSLILSTLPIIFVFIGFYRNNTGQTLQVVNVDPLEKQKQFTTQLPTILQNKLEPEIVENNHRGGVAWSTIKYKVKHWDLSYGIGLEGLNALGYIKKNIDSKVLYCRGFEGIRFTYFEEGYVLVWSFPEYNCNP